MLGIRIWGLILFLVRRHIHPGPGPHAAFGIPNDPHLPKFVAFRRVSLL
jgi:hypothetical protein